MDINRIYNNSHNETGVIEKSLLWLSVNSAPKTSFVEEESQTDALVAIKKDPAVIEVKITVEKTVVSNNAQDYVKQSPKKDTEPKNRLDFENMLRLERAALFSLPPNMFDLLMKYVDILRMQRLQQQKQMECGFCKKYGHPAVWYTTHALKDGKGRVRCPILRTFVCWRCGATGNNAHTMKYCPKA